MSQFPHPMASFYQQEPEKIQQAVTFLEQKAREAKMTIEELLAMLDLQEKVPWPDMLERFASLASVMSNIENALKKSGLQSASVEDHGALLRTHVLVPQRLQLDPDPQLSNITGSRLVSWNHDVVPDYLRTKMNPELESEENYIDMDKNTKGLELISRQTNSLNKHVDSLMQTLPSAATTELLDKPTFNREETNRLVRAIMMGDGLRGQMPPQQRAPGQSGPQMMPTSTPGGAGSQPPRAPSVMPQTFR